jgi:hypothetical protein
MNDPIPASKKLRRRKAECAQCGGLRNCNVRGDYCESGDDDVYQWRRDWYILECRGCEYVFIQTVGTSSEDYDHNDDGATELNEHIEYWPARSKRERPVWMSNIQRGRRGTRSLDVSLDELYRALDHDMNMLAAIGIRTTFDIAAELLEIDERFSFKDKLIELVNKGHVKAIDLPQLETLVEAGNASAHRGWKPGAEDLEALMTVLEGFIHEAFWAPELKRRLKAQLDETSAKVPKRDSPAKAATQAHA